MRIPRAAMEAFKFSALISWRSTGKQQQTIARCIEKTGRALHSGDLSTVRIWPELAGTGSVRTVEHLLSALEGTGVDNCRIEIMNSGSDDTSVEVPIFDGSAREWVEAIDQVGLTDAMDCNGRSCDRVAPYLTQPVHVSKGDSVIAAFPANETNISYGIDFPQVSDLSLKWYSSSFCTGSFYSKQIAPSRTFCIYEEVEKMRSAGLIKGGSAENAVAFSISKGLLNPPLRSLEEPCRHKVLDFIGDVSLFARRGSQGLPVANIIAFKGGHSLHAEFVRKLSSTS
ncbi:putative UDP-3-O-acyl-N-acetylglucosamine deacetylase [Helianthus annuus]|uniref:UDP-3-O-acyl-N-acetylglucosamine deacetylase n=1 Tax=Helianthus annuus TaxID=4232 RepID=A0A9K3H1S8_HELAN|nr:putative UDP-3-O-acyl-N-acetylglucosamine deacetylase [Helianthus annuus]KAJ0830849.1 putative UDP-3-O-acyl-N-acetylglucosamine deacetylase [Helianthus annuus]